MDSDGAVWRKSSWSSGGGDGDCVEIAILTDAVMVRDSQRPDGPILTFARTEWQAFLDVIRRRDCRPERTFIDEPGVGPPPAMR